MKYEVKNNRIWWPNSVPVPEGVTPVVVALVDGHYRKMPESYLEQEGSYWCFPNVPQSYTGYLGSHHRGAPPHLDKVWVIYDVSRNKLLEDHVYADKGAVIFACLLHMHKTGGRVRPQAAYTVTQGDKTHVVRMKDVKVIE